MTPTHLPHQRFLHLLWTLKIPPTPPRDPLSPLTPKSFPLQHLRSLALPQCLLRTCWTDRETLRTPSCLLEVQTLGKLAGMLVTTWQTLGGVLLIWPTLPRSSIRPGQKNQHPASHRTSPTLTQRRSCSRGYSSCRSNRQKDVTTGPSSQVPILMRSVRCVCVVAPGLDTSRWVRSGWRSGTVPRGTNSSWLSTPAGTFQP